MRTVLSVHKIEIPTVVPKDRPSPAGSSQAVPLIYLNPYLWFIYQGSKLFATIHSYSDHVEG